MESNWTWTKSTPCRTTSNQNWCAGEASETDCLPVLLLELSEQLHIVRAELRWRGRWEGRRGQRCRGGGGSGLQGRGRGHLASHLTDRVGHRVLHPWESRTQLTSNLVCRHLQRKKNTSKFNKSISAGWSKHVHPPYRAHNFLTPLPVNYPKLTVFTTNTIFM